jgi:hypothetical protein
MATSPCFSSEGAELDDPRGVNKPVLPRNPTSELLQKYRGYCPPHLTAFGDLKHLAPDLLRPNEQDHAHGKHRARQQKGEEELE